MRRRQYRRHTLSRPHDSKTCNCATDTKATRIRPIDAGITSRGVRQNRASWLLYHVSSSTFWMETDVWNIVKAQLWNPCPLVDTRFITNCQSDYIFRGHKFRTTPKKTIIQQTSYHINLRQTKTMTNFNLMKKSIKIPNIKFHENPSSGNRTVACGLT